MSFKRGVSMVKKVVNKGTLDDPKMKNTDLIYWLRKTTNERIEAVEFLRRQYHGNTTRLQRIARVTQQS